MSRWKEGSMELWKDSTSYRQNQTDRTPTSYRLTIDWLTASITCAHIYNPKRWSLSVSGMFEVKDIGIDDTHSAEEAKLIAETMIRDRLQNVLLSLK